MDYGQYLDQITYLLFLKMWSDASPRPRQTKWALLQSAPTEEILNIYDRTLTSLADDTGKVGEVFTGARSEFSSGASLAQLISMIDDMAWADLDRDIQADAFEYLLEQAAAEGKKGAGQYFTPRSLMRSIVACIRPGGVESDRVVADPAAGTGGFLVAAKEWVDSNDLPQGSIQYWGQELVQRPRRLALMNALLHEMQPTTIQLGDALRAPMPVRADVILANPPFGSHGGKVPERSDFWFRTTNKQANFVQHIAGALSDRGRAAVIVPDSCLFGDVAVGLLPGLSERVNLHTLLRLPEGMFAPYTSGTKTNVLFFTAGRRTSETWVYDARTRDGVTQGRLSAVELDEFVTCFGHDARDAQDRAEQDSPSNRWRRFSIEDLRSVDYEIDRLDWRAKPATFSPQDQLRPLREARKSVLSVIDELDSLLALLKVEDEPS